MNQISIEKILFFIIVLFVLIGSLFLSYLFIGRSKNLELVFPKGAEELLIGETYEISWKARNIDKVGIVLFKGEESEWIAQGIDGSLEKYEWKIQPGKNYGGSHWIAVFEYPFREEALISYSSSPFTIIFADTESCDSLSVENEWPYIPVNYSNTRRVFTTKEKYNGNMGGLGGADEICKREAESLELEGEWTAFLGGDRDTDTALQRLTRTSRGTEGIFIRALPEGALAKGGTCHRLLANDFNGFLGLFLNPERDEFSDLWLGRINSESVRKCLEITESRRGTQGENYSLTVTCQNWNNSKRLVEKSEELPLCYTAGGSPVEAMGLGGISFYDKGEACNEKKHILCIES